MRRMIVNGTEITLHDNGTWTGGGEVLMEVMNDAAEIVLEEATPADGFPLYLVYDRAAAILKPEETEPFVVPPTPPGAVY